MTTATVAAGVGAEGGNFDRLPVSGTPWVAQGSTGHSPSQERSADSRGLEKKLPQDLAALLTPEVLGTRTARIMFQDEARFGRMVRIRRCQNSTPRNMSGMNYARRNFPTAYSSLWRPSSVSLKLASHEWRQILKR